MTCTTYWGAVFDCRSGCGSRNGRVISWAMTFASRLAPEMRKRVNNESKKMWAQGMQCLKSGWCLFCWCDGNWSCLYTLLRLFLCNFYVFVQFFFFLMKTAVAISGQLLHRYCVTFSSNFWSPCLTRIHPPTLSASNHTPIRPVPQTHTPTWTILTLPSGQEKTLLNLKRRRLKRSESLHLHC